MGGVSASGILHLCPVSVLPPPQNRAEGSERGDCRSAVKETVREAIGGAVERFVRGDARGADPGVKRAPLAE